MHIQCYPSNIWIRILLNLRKLYPDTDLDAAKVKLCLNFLHMDTFLSNSDINCYILVAAENISANNRNAVEMDLVV